MTAFRFRLKLTELQRAACWRHAGAARFAYNRGLAMVCDALQLRHEKPETKIPWSGFDLINAFNKWKLSADAGTDGERITGLAWRQQVCAQVFEEALVDLGKGLARFSADKKAGKQNKSAFPKRKKRNVAKPTFRLRNKRHAIRVSATSIVLPKLGELKRCGSTRSLRRLLRPDAHGEARAKVLFVTVSHSAGHWYVSVNVEAPVFHQAIATQKQQKRVVGIDVGLRAFAVAANADCIEQWRAQSPKALKRYTRRLIMNSRALTRKQKGSKNRTKARQQLARLHARIANIRHDFLHKLTSYVAKTHSHVALEDLNVKGLLQNHCLARHIADASWSEHGRMLTYKAAWYGCALTRVPRFHTTTKACSQCAYKVSGMTLKDRWFNCPACGFSADRDTNAAAGCAAWVERASNENVTGKPPETLTDCGEERSGLVVKPSETGLDEAVIDLAS